MAENKLLDKEKQIKEIRKQIEEKIKDESTSAEEMQELFDEYLILISK